MRDKRLPCALSVLLAFALWAEGAFAGHTPGSAKPGPRMQRGGPTVDNRTSLQPKPITLFLSGDIMTGRGIDQALAHPGNPLLHEPVMRSAKGYVRLAERMNGPIPRPVSCSYLWGAALEEFEKASPDLRIINLETAVTTSDDHWRGKGIHYRMHPENAACLKEASIDVVSLANNHVLDWGQRGLFETLETLRKVNIRPAGAGRNRAEAEKPAVVEVPGKGRVVVFSYGLETSGILGNWAASKGKPGVNLLRNLSGETVRQIEKKIEALRRDRDVVVASIHWGPNWGHAISREQREFAHELIDRVGVDVVHGHSSHHAKAIEVYRNRLILYGCGDLINDYEGIGGHQRFRGDLGLLYFARVDPATGRLLRLRMTPTQMRQFAVTRAGRADAIWLRDTLNREGKQFGTRVELGPEGRLTLQWD
jgi:poly-gamma-glutamate capsule biosynthesis protein CapA/YwtB (metallophosphatase superfamily)